MKDTPGPLKDITVLDLSRVLVGPFCSMMLADMGADVIKVEEPGVGDETRTWGPPFVEGEATYFLSINRNKRSITVNLRSEAGRNIVYRLAERADIVLENFRPGVAKRLQVDYDTLQARNPRLLYTSFSAFGQTGPYAERPGYDLVLQAMGGIMSLTGYPDRPPVKMGVAISDLAAGMFAAYAIVSALYSRSRTGKGQYIDVALLDGQIALLTAWASSYFATGKAPGRYGSGHPQIVPYQAFPTLTIEIIVCVTNEKFWGLLCDLLALPSLKDDPRYRTNPDRVQNRDSLLPMLEAEFLSRPGEEWLERLQSAGIPSAPINTVDRALGDPQVLARGMVVEVDHPTAGRLKLPGPPYKLSETPATVRTAPPLLGQHTDEILAQFGYSPTEIQDLRQMGAV
jgi:crotonobetainyl-CoA:carnitine CoA-transferase CaiB-like acyl-CoA transferase